MSSKFQKYSYRTPRSPASLQQSWMLKWLKVPRTIVVYLNKGGVRGWLLSQTLGGPFSRLSYKRSQKRKAGNIVINVFRRVDAETDLDPFFLPRASLVSFTLFLHSLTNYTTKIVN